MPKNPNTDYKCSVELISSKIIYFHAPVKNMIDNKPNKFNNNSEVGE